MNGLARRQVPRRDHNVFAEFCHGGRGCFHALPISSSRLTTFGARRPSRVGGAFRIKLQCLRFSGSSHSSTTVVTALRVPFVSALLPEPTICKGHTRKARHVAVFRNLLSGILLKRLHIGIVESTRRILTGR